MPSIKFSQIPKNYRVKLNEKGKKELWHRVDEFGGVKNLAQAFQYSQSKIYNWKSKDLALPVNFTRQIMGENNTEAIIALKGPGSSSKIKKPQFPLRPSNELLTRIELSVKENKDGTPMYLTNEKNLAQRFAELLDQIGEIEYTVYDRKSRYEVRYPKFLNDVFKQISYKEKLSAIIDEKGKIKQRKIHLPRKTIPVDQFNEKLHSRKKEFELALQKEDTEKITEIMRNESSKVEKLVNK